MNIDRITARETEPKPRKNKLSQLLFEAAKNLYNTTRNRNYINDFTYEEELTHNDQPNATYLELFTMIQDPSSELRVSRKKDLLVQAANIEVFDTVKQLSDKLDELSDLRNNTESQQERDATINDINLILNELWTHGVDGENSLRIISMLNDLDEGKVHLEGHDTNAVNIINAINDFYSLNDKTALTAPFADYQANTNKAWKYVPHHDTVDYLKQRRFIDTTFSDHRAHAQKYIISSTQGIPVKSDLLVYAAGFDSWLGRGHEGRGEKGTSSLYSKYPPVDPSRRDTSLDTIKHYASLPSDLPPVGFIQIWLRPDGKAFADNANGDSHRIAAGILRGDEFIYADHVSIGFLKENTL